MPALPKGILATILAAAMLAGCVTIDADIEPGADVGDDIWDLLSPILYGDLIKEHAPVASFDGTILDTWVYRPDVPEGETVPVFIEFSPYWGNLKPPASASGYPFADYLLDFLVPRGYAVVLASARGTGSSDGCFTIGGESELRDSFAVVEHFASLPWSNGNVAMGGKSYDGTIPHGALVAAPPGLKTIIPFSGISELYKYNYVNGVAYAHGRIFNAYYSVGMMAPPRGTDTTDHAGYYARAGCPEQVFVQGHGAASGITGDYTDYWMERNYTARIEAAAVAVGGGENLASVLFVHGLQDWNVKPDHILPWVTELRNHGVTVRMELGQWGHDFSHREDWNLTMLRWLDHYLKGIDTGMLDEPMVHVQDSLARWRTEAEWPPTRAATKTLHLREDGTLTEEAPAGAATFAFLDNGQRARAAPVGPADHDVLFDSGELEDDLHVAGEPTATLFLDHSTPAGQVVLTLWDVSPTNEWTQMNWGIMSLRHHESLQNPKPVVPGQVMQVNLNFYPQDDVFQKGHRLVLTIAGNGGTVSPVPSLGTTTIHVSAERPSAIFLPVVNHHDNAYEEPAPVMVGCWVC